MDSLNLRVVVPLEAIGFVTNFSTLVYVIRSFNMRDQCCKTFLDRI
jgi:hypothetical protein